MFLTLTIQSEQGWKRANHLRERKWRSSMSAHRSVLENCLTPPTLLLEIKIFGRLRAYFGFRVATNHPEPQVNATPSEAIYPPRAPIAESRYGHRTPAAKPHPSTYCYDILSSRRLRY